MINRLRFLFTHTRRSVLRGGRRTVVAMLCVTVGVAAVVALQVAAATVGDALTTNVRASNGGDVALTSDSSPLAAADLTTVDDLRRRGWVTRSTAVSRLRVTAPGAVGTLVPFDVNVVDLASYPLAGDPTFTSPMGGAVRSLMSSPGEVLISSVLADELGVRIGSRVEVSGVGGSGLRATVRGILAQANLEHAALMVVRAGDAPALSRRRPEYVVVDLNTAPGRSGAVATALRTRFPSATVTTVDEALKSAQQQVHDFREYTLLSGLVTLLVAGVGIFNAMHSVLASRQIELSMLKAIGFRPTSLFGLLAVEAGTIGLAGGLLGTAVGLLASGVITSAVARAAALQAPLHIDVSTIALGIGLGAAATVLFSILPIVRSAQLRPLAMLRPASDVAGTVGAGTSAGLVALTAVLFAVLAGVVVGDLVAGLWLVLGVTLLCLAFGALFAGATALSARIRPPQSRLAALGVLAVLVAATLGAVLIVPAVAAVIALLAMVWALAAVIPGPGRIRMQMAARSLDRRRTRTAVTLVAFLAGIFAMSLTVTLAGGLRNQITTALASAGSTNLVGVASEPTRDALLAGSARLPNLQGRTVTTTASGVPTAVDGRPLAGLVTQPQGADAEDNPLRGLNGISGSNLAAGTTPAGLVARQGRLLRPADAGTANVVVESRFGGPPLSLRPGSTISFIGSGGGPPVTVSVVGLYGRSGTRGPLDRLSGPRVYGDAALADRLGAGDSQTIVSMSVAADTLVHDSVLLQRAAPGALVINVNDLTAVVRTILDNLITVLIVVTGLTLVAGITVVGNGVTLAMIERRREIAVMKALGYAPRSVIALVLVENAFSGLLAGSVSVVVVAVGIAVLSRNYLSTPIAFSPALSGLVLVIAVAVSVVTAAAASRRAVALRPTEVLRDA